MAREASRPFTAEDIRRRLVFIIEESQQENPLYDQTVRYALRVLCNVFCVGRDCGSRYVYKNSRYASQAALHHMRDVPEKDWSLRSEHQEPLVAVWTWLREVRRTPKELEAPLRQWPMVVITKAEDDRLDRREMESGPAVRKYRGAGEAG